MGKKQIWDIQRNYSDDFTVIKDSLLLCKFCDTIVNWRKKTRVQEHMNTKMHQDRKENKLMLWTEAAATVEAENDEDDWEEEETDDPLHLQPHQEGPSFDGQQYSLKWNNHKNNLLKVFTRLLGAEQFTDVLLAAEGRTIRAHKVVLSACSSYFERLFTEFDEKNQIVIMRDTSYADISAIVEFMYKGEINVAQNQLASLLKTAESLKVKGLAEVSTTGDGMNSLTPKHSSNPSISGPGSTSNQSQFNAQPVEVVNGETAKRKRGRPRLYDAPTETEVFYPQNTDHSKSHSQAMAQSVSSKLSDVTSSSHAAAEPADFQWISDSPMFATMGDEPTPGGPLTEERIKTLGIVKMNDYIKSGTRHQFWEEYYVRVVMQAVRNKEIDMKGGAEHLGVSYGTLYGRYRELFGYVKHAWNVAGRPLKVPSFPTSTFWTDPNNHQALEQLKDGKINVKQAASLMGMDPSALVFQLSGKFSDDCTSPSPYKMGRMEEDDDILEEPEEEEYSEQDPGHFEEERRERKATVGPSVTIQQVTRFVKKQEREEGVDPMDDK